jgi:glycosyltransferase involved in cell wall biosynthesis
MRLLYVHECFGSLGGAESNVISAARELRKRGHSIAIVSQKRSGKGEEAWQEVFSPVIFSPGSWRELLAREKPDLIYMHKWADLDSIEFLAEAGVPIVRMIHDHDLYCLRSYKYNPLTRKICTRPATGYCVFPCMAPIKRERGGTFPFRWVSYGAKIREIELNRRFDRFLVPSDYMKHELIINGFPEDRIKKFPPVPASVEPLRSTFGPRNIVLFAGQIIRGKGVDVLLRALKLVKEPFEAVIFGEGHHRRFCEKLARRLGLENRVKFLGFVPQAELRNCYEEATVVVVPSVWPEPFATIGVEAMRYGLPVVAFDVGGIGEWLKDGENGFLVPWMDTQSFAGRLDQLLRDKGLARTMGEAGLAKASRDYDFGQYISSLEELFARVVAEKKTVSI